MQDEQIIKQVLKGNVEQYSVLIDRYSARLHSTAYSYTHNYEESRDLVQEILIKSYKSLSSYKAEAKFSTWLYRIAVNCCIDWYRRAKSKAPTTTWSCDDGTILDKLTTEADGPEEGLLRQEHNETIRNALDKIPEIYKTVLILYYFEELKVQEICSILDSPRRTIETRLYRAKGILKAALTQELKGGELYELQNL